MNGWIGVDFDGTLAKYEGWVTEVHCGDPVEAMVERVRRWRSENREVRIFTARIWPIATIVDGISTMIPIGDGDVQWGRKMQAVRAVDAIQAWSKLHLGEVLPITCVKDYGMIELWDDRAVQVRPNTGEMVGDSTRGLA